MTCVCECYDMVCCKSSHTFMTIYYLLRCVAVGTESFGRLIVSYEL